MMGQHSKIGLIILHIKHRDTAPTMSSSCGVMTSRTTMLKRLSMRLKWSCNHCRTKFIRTITQSTISSGHQWISICKASINMQTKTRSSGSVKREIFGHITTCQLKMHTGLATSPQTQTLRTWPPISATSPSLPSLSLLSATAQKHKRIRLKH